MQRGVIRCKLCCTRVIANGRLRVGEVLMEIAEVVMSFGKSRIEFDRSQETVLGRLETKCRDVGDAEIVVSASTFRRKRDRAGQHSIRVNQQWRVCFRWTTDGPEAVEIVDYH